MKLPIRCFDCTEDLRGQGHIALVEFRDDGRYEAVCPRGHRTIIVLQQSLFEVLFEIGAYAIRDGYYREAVSSFTASLERLYEIFIRTLLVERKVDPEIVEESWKEISAQSERQLGAFIFLYTTELGRTPQILGQKQVAFRNSVIHRGKIPSKEQSIAYGQVVLDLMRPIIAVLRSKYATSLMSVIQSDMRGGADGKGIREAGSGVMSIPTIACLTDRGREWDERSLERAIHELADWEARLAQNN